MPILSARIVNFRNLQHIDISKFSTQLNCFYGINGSGKTSLLEAFYYLHAGRSFRTSSINTLAHHHAEKFEIFTHLEASKSRQTSLRVGIEKYTNGEQRLRLEEKDIHTFSEIAACLPLQLIQAHSHLLIEGNPIIRRKFLNWGLFYQTPAFLLCWRQFERALKQRNILLKTGGTKSEWSAWTDELIKHSDELNDFRTNYVANFIPVLIKINKVLLPNMAVDICYRPGWDDSMSYRTVLENNYKEELRLGNTLFGPHRADLILKISGATAKYRVSRGQQKMLICAMILAQGMLAAATRDCRLTYLVDDLTSELDMESQLKIIDLLSQQDAQLLVTTIEQTAALQWIKSVNVPTQLFHVKHGTVVEIK